MCIVCDRYPIKHSVFKQNNHLCRLKRLLLSIVAWKGVRQIPNKEINFLSSMYKCNHIKIPNMKNVIWKETEKVWYLYRVPEPCLWRMHLLFGQTQIWWIRKEEEML